MVMTYKSAEVQSSWSSRSHSNGTHCVHIIAYKIENVTVRCMYEEVDDETRCTYQSKHIESMIIYTHIIKKQHTYTNQRAS